MFLEELWERGLSNLYRIDKDKGGIFFNCFDVATSIQIAGFDANGASAVKGKITSEDENTSSWEVFVPFGKTCTLHWFQQWNVAVLCTETGALEIASEWIGGGDLCRSSGCVLPNGETITVSPDDKEPHVNFDEVCRQWEQVHE